MTLAEVLALVKSLSDTVGALTSQVKAHEAQIAALLTLVAQHDTQLKTAPDPGPRVN